MIKKFLNTFLRQYYESNLNRKKIIAQLRRYHDKKFINMELLSMLLGVFKVQETRVKDIMIPRSSMVIIKKNSSLDDILPLIIDSSHSRFPVILENKDEIVGILLAKDLLKYLAKKNGSFDIEKVIRPSVIIPETKKLNVLLSEFKSGRNHLAVVVDEYGGVSGLITIEDVLEQIVGDIIDEHDSVETSSNIKKSRIPYIQLMVPRLLRNLMIFLRVTIKVQILILLVDYLLVNSRAYLKRMML